MVKYTNMNEYIKRKISNKLKGRKKSKKTKELISEAMKGKNKSQEHKDAISYGMKCYWQKHKRSSENENKQYNFTTSQGDKTSHKT